jgi:hypothetical protein
MNCGGGAHSAFYATCVQVQNANGSWSNTSTCGANKGSLNGSGMGTSFVGFHEVSNRTYRVATYGVASGASSGAIVYTGGFGQGTTTIG